MATEHAAFESDIQDHIMTGHVNNVHSTARRILGYAPVAAAREQAIAAGVSPLAIFFLIMQMVMQAMTSGKPIDIQAIIAAILAFFTKPVTA